MLNPALRENALHGIKNLNEFEFYERLNGAKELAKLNSDRKKLLFQFSRGKHSVSPLGQFDIEQFLLKHLAKYAYDSNHHCIDFEKCSYEYDPAKNGHNIVKHGLSFSEVVSFSTRFGAMSVPLPEDKEKRFAVFSDLRVGPNEKLEMPLGNLDDINPIVSIVTHREGGAHLIKMRFISSRRISSKEGECRNDLKNIFKNIVDDENIRGPFIDDCLKIIKTRLMTA